MPLSPRRLFANSFGSCKIPATSKDIAMSLDLQSTVGPINKSIPCLFHQRKCGPASQHTPNEVLWQTLQTPPVAQNLSKKMLLWHMIPHHTFASKRHKELVQWVQCLLSYPGYPMVCESAKCKLERRGDCLQNPNTQATSGEIHHNGDRSFPTNSMAHLVVLCNHNEHLYRRLFFRLHKTFVL